jgi:hypothetical protein
MDIPLMQNTKFLVKKSYMDNKVLEKILYNREYEGNSAT